MNMFKTITILLFLFIFQNVFSQFAPKQGQHGKYTYTYFENDPTQLRIYKLENGLSVYISPNDETPRFQSFIAVKAGSKHDPADNTGLAHYLEHMLFKGTDKFGTMAFEKEKVYLDQIDNLYEKYNQSKDQGLRTKIYAMIDSLSQLASQYSIANEYDKMMQHIGAEGTNAYTWFEETVYINNVPSNQLDNWLKIEAERFRNPILRIFHTELEAVYEEKNISLNSDNSKVYEKIMAELFKYHAYGTQTTIGTVEHLKNPSLNKIRAYYQKYYVPNNMAIVIVGNVKPEEAIEKIDANFSYMKPKEIEPLKFRTEEKRTEKRTFTVFGPEAESVSIAYRLPSIQNKNYYLTEIVFSLLSNGKAGLIDKNLVTSQKVLEAYAYQYSLKDHGVAFLGGSPKTGQTLEQVEILLKEQIEKLKIGDFDENLLSAIAENYYFDKVKSYETNSGRIGDITEAFINDLDWQTVLSRYDLMKKVTKEKVMKFANQYFTEDHVVVYKKTGEDKNIEQIEKPKITPINLNRDKMSRFTKTIMVDKVEPLKPEFLEYRLQLRKKELQPGLELFSVRNVKNDLFKLYYVFEFGSHSDKYLDHAASLIELFGIEGKSASEIKKEFYMIACNFSVYVSAEQIYVMLSGPQKNFDNAVKMMENLFHNIQPDKAIYNDYLSRIFQDRKDNLLNQYAISSALRNYAFYGKINPTTYVLTNKELKKTNPEIFTDKIKDLTNYELSIIYYGPEKLDDIEKIIKELHKSPAQLKPKPESYPFRFQEYSKPVVFTANFDMVTANVNWVKKSNDFAPEKTTQARLYNEYFGGGMSSVVFQTIRESKALAYSSYAYFSSPSRKEKPFTFYAFVGTQSDKVFDAINAMNELITELPESDQSFNTAKKSIKSSIEAQRIRNEQVVFNYLSSRRLGIDYDIRKNIYNQIDALTFADLTQFHEDFIRNKTGAYAILGSSKRIDKKKLGQYGTLKQMKTKNLFNY